MSNTQNNVRSGLRQSMRIKFGGLAFIFPAVLLNLMFFLYPFIQTLRMSFYEWPLIGEKTLLGFSNYTKLLIDAQFWSSLWFTMKYTLLVTPAIFIIAFTLAMLINKRLPGVSIFRAVYFTPVVISMVSSALMWLWIYNDLYGVFNYYLLNFNIIEEPIYWLGHAKTSLPAVTLMITWKMAGLTMIILLAGLQSIPNEIYEAASIDGASFVDRIIHITIPLLKPSIGLALIISVIGSVLGFEQFLIMTKGGPSNTTTTIVHYIYNQSFKYFHFGYGSAMTVILLIILIVLSFVQLRVLRSPS